MLKCWGCQKKLKYSKSSSVVCQVHNLLQIFCILYVFLYSAFSYVSLFLLLKWNCSSTVLTLLVVILHALYASITEKCLRMCLLWWLVKVLHGSMCKCEVTGLFNQCAELMCCLTCFGSLYRDLYTLVMKTVTVYVYGVIGALMHAVARTSNVCLMSRINGTFVTHYSRCKMYRLQSSRYSR